MPRRNFGAKKYRFARRRIGKFYRMYKGQSKYNRKPFRRSLRNSIFLRPSTSIIVNLRETGTVSQDTEFKTNGLVFKLQDFNSQSKFTAIFEQFQIIKITQKLYPTADTFIAPTKIAKVLADDDEQITQVYTPLIVYKIDRDDVETPSNLDDCLKNPAYKVRNFKKPVTISWKPNVLNNIYQGAVTNNYAIKYGAWLNCENSSDCEHYGLVRACHIGGCSATYPMTYRIITTATVKFKGLRLDES